ncbi:MAG: delta-60 repeat domain-containing protein, partial [Nitrospira sp.]
MKITLKSLTILAFAINSLLPLGTAQAGALELNEDLRTPMFGQPAPAFRTVLLPDGKYLLFWSTDTLTDQRTGAITRYLPDGSLDETFALSRTYKFVGAAASTDGGQVIVAATRYLYDSPITEIIRLNADGSIDPTFNINVADRTANIGVRAMVIQPDGKILVAGLFEDFAGTGQQKIVRLLANGTLDPSFTPPPFYEGETVGIMTKPVVLSDGKILIAGNFSFMGEGVARLHPDGSYDPAFWASGYTINAFSPVRGVILQDDGKIVLGGQLRVWFPKGGSVYVPLFRLEANGDPDMSYTHVTTLSAFARDLAAQPDGKILAANLNSVYRFNTDGSLDNSFTPPVLLNAALSLPSSPGAYTVDIQPDGQILIGGFFPDVNLPPGPPDGSEFGVARLNADGTLDPSLATSRRTGLETYPKSFARLFDG